MLSKQELNDLASMRWLLDNPGKTLVSSAAAESRLSRSVQRVKQQLAQAGKQVESKPAVIDGKPTKDVILWLNENGSQ